MTRSNKLIADMGEGSGHCCFCDIHITVDDTCRTWWKEETWEEICTPCWNNYRAALRRAKRRRKDSRDG